MPRRFQATSFLHSEDIVQREFERKDKKSRQYKQMITDIQNLTNQTGVTQSAIQELKSSKIVQSATGTVVINRLPESSEDEGYYWTPSNGYYGWYVYNTISHNLDLAHPDEFIIELIDLQSYDGTNFDIDYDNDSDVDETDEYLWSMDKHGKLDNFLEFGIVEEHVFVPRYRGIDANRIRVWGIYKPDIHDWFGEERVPQQLDLIDTYIARTNLVFRYTVYKPIKEIYDAISQ